MTINHLQIAIMAFERYQGTDVILGSVCILTILDVLYQLADFWLAPSIIALVHGNDVNLVIAQQLLDGEFVDFLWIIHSISSL